MPLLAMIEGGIVAAGVLYKLATQERISKLSGERVSKHPLSLLTNS